jgi:hypothetical protein
MFGSLGAISVMQLAKIAATIDSNGKRGKGFGHSEQVSLPFFGRVKTFINIFILLGT